MTNCNHKYGLLLTRRHDVNMSTKLAHVEWNWPILRELYLKIDWSIKMPLHWFVMGVAVS